MRRTFIILAAVLLASPAFAQVEGSAPARSSGNNSGTVTTGGTYQSLNCCTASTRSLEFENICGISGNCNATTDNCYLWWNSNALPASPTKATSLVIPPGSYYGRFSGTVASDVFQVTCDGAADKYWSEQQ